jgi:hypothetical protein
LNERERYEFTKRVIALRVAGRERARLERQRRRGRESESEREREGDLGLAGLSLDIKREDGHSETDEEEERMREEEDEEDDELNEIFWSGVFYSHMVRPPPWRVLFHVEKVVSDAHTTREHADSHSTNCLPSRAISTLPPG